MPCLDQQLAVLRTVLRGACRGTGDAGEPGRVGAGPAVLGADQARTTIQAIDTTTSSGRATMTVQTWPTRMRPCMPRSALACVQARRVVPRAALF